MAFLGRSDKTALGKVGFAEEPLEVGRVLITHIKRTVITKLSGFLLNFDSMFVGADREKRVAVSQQVEPMYSIAVYGGVEVSNVGSSIDIKDWRHDQGPSSGKISACSITCLLKSFYHFYDYN